MPLARGTAGCGAPPRPAPPRVRAASSLVRSRWRRAPGERDGWSCRPAPWGRPRWSQRPEAASVHGPTAAGRRGGAQGGARALRPRRAGGARRERGGLSGPAAASAKCGGGRAESPTSGSALGRGGPLRGRLTDMSAAKENPCRKFQANIFNKSKCQNCFKPRESHLLNDEDLTQVSCRGCGAGNPACESCRGVRSLRRPRENKNGAGKKNA